MSMPPKNWFRLKEHLETLEDRRAQAKELCAALGWSSAVLIGACRPGIESGELKKIHDGREVIYELTDGPNGHAIRWQWWDDGDIVVYGLCENDDGSHTIPRAVVDEFRRRFTGVTG